MIKIKVLIAEKGKAYTDGTIKGKVVWVEKEEDINNWKLISAVEIKPNIINETLNLDFNVKE